MHRRGGGCSARGKNSARTKCQVQIEARASERSAVIIHFLPSERAVNDSRPELLRNSREEDVLYLSLG